MKARDVLVECWNEVGEIGKEEVRALLDCTPEGEGVYIAPDGTLMGRCAEWPTRHTDHYCDDPDCDGNGWVPIEGDERD